MKALARALAVGGMLGLGGCALTPPKIGEPPPKVKDGQAEKEYLKILNQYSAIREIYSLFDTRVFVGATYQGWDFREQRVRRTALFRAEPSPVLEQKLAAEKAEAEQFNDFFMAVHVNDWHYDDFDRKNSIWRVALVSEQGEFTPTEIRRVGRADLNMRALYPYADEFWVGYRVRFNKDALKNVPGDHFILRLASTLGKTDLAFRL